MGGALDTLAAGRADALMAAKLDRVSRSIGDLARLMDTAARERWALVLLDVAVDTSTSMGEALAGMAAVFGQLERRLIGDRTKAALAVAKARGTRLGRPATMPG